MHLNELGLLKNRCLINGEWQTAENGQTFLVNNPANGEVVGEVPDMSVNEARSAIAAAYAAQPAWAAKTAQERSKILYRWFELIMEHQDDLAMILTLEQGKPLVEAKGEIAYGASYIEWFSEEAKRIYGNTIPALTSDQRISVIHQAIGVCAAITPWNFPNAMITRKAAPALAAGCTFVFRPDSQTPLSALAIVELACRAGIPAGVINIVTGLDAQSIGEVFTQDERVRKFSFTGSTAVGKKLMAQCASTVKKVSLELGGNAPFIVFDDADINEAVKGAIASKFRNAGQTCVCTNRFYVQNSVYDEFVEKLTAAVCRLKIGNGWENQVDIGPMIHEKAVHKMHELIENAQNNGGKILCGGHADGLFMQPTVISEATQAMRFAQEEIFGPIAPIFRFDNEQEVIHFANDTEFGLASYLYTRDIGRLTRVSEALEYGMVAVNTGILSNTAAPFGGVKQSGIGREGSQYGMHDYLEMKYIVTGGIHS